MNMFFCMLALLVTLNAHDVSIVLSAVKNTTNNALKALTISHVDFGILFVVIHIHIV